MIGEPVTERNAGTERATEVTVPVVGVVQVQVLPAAEVNTWPDVPALEGKIKFQAEPVVFALIATEPEVLPTTVTEFPAKRFNVAFIST